MGHESKPHNSVTLCVQNDLRGEMVSTYGKDVYLLFLVYFETVGTDLTLTTAFRSTSFSQPIIIDFHCHQRNSTYGSNGRKTC